MLGALTLPEIPTSRSLVVQDKDMLPAETNGNDVSRMSPIDSAFAIFSDMRDLLQEVVLNTSK